MSNSPLERIPRDARVLVICVARIGDTVLNTPVLQAIKTACPEGEVTCLAHPKRLEVLQGLTCIDRLVGITKKTAWWQGRLGSKRWDYALVYGKDDALFDYARRTAHRVVGFARPEAEGPAHPIDIAVTPPASTSHAVDERLMLPQAIGIYAQSKRLLYRVSALERDTAESWISHRISGGATNLVGLQIASFPTKAYRDWPIDYVIALCKRIVAQYDDVKLLCLGGPADVQKGKAIAMALGDKCESIAGELSIRESSAVMARLSLYIGVDTGPTHIAGALGIPMVALYHCRHRGTHLAPLEHPAPLRVIEHPQTNAGCSTESPMSDISVDRVWAAVQEVLDEVRHPEISPSRQTEGHRARRVSN